MNKKKNYYINGELMAVTLDAQTTYDTVGRFLNSKNDPASRAVHRKAMERLAGWLKSEPREGDSIELSVGRPSISVTYKESIPSRPTRPVKAFNA